MMKNKDTQQTNTYTLSLLFQMFIALYVAYLPNNCGAALWNKTTDLISWWPFTGRNYQVIFQKNIMEPCICEVIMMLFIMICWIRKYMVMNTCHHPQFSHVNSMIVISLTGSIFCIQEILYLCSIPSLCYSILIITIDDACFKKDRRKTLTCLVQ